MMNEEKAHPWSSMAVETQRRVEGKTIHDIFWARDADGRFGLFVDTVDYFSARAWRVSLKGVDVLKKPVANGGRYFLILRQNADWEIFVLLCEDLISVAQTGLSGRQLIARMQGRLHEWQRLLEHDVSGKLPLELQMGLYTELTLLSEFLIPSVGGKSSLMCWGGPEADKQDFSFDRVVVEVKSYLSKKGPTVWISSLHQLWPEKENFFLVGYGLSVSEAGRSIKDVVTDIVGKLQGDVEMRDLLERKLAQYGYFPKIHSEGLSGFLVDSRHFYRVETTFPRINPADVPFGVDSLRYSVDLGRCQDFGQTAADVESFLL